MKRNKQLLPALAMALSISSVFSASLSASDLNYSYIEGEFQITSSGDDFESDDAYSISASYQFMDKVYAFGGFFKGSGTMVAPSKLENAKVKLNYDLDGYRLGAGYIHPINTNWDANFTVGFEKTDYDRDGETELFIYKDSVKDDGMFVGAGVRGMLNPEVELSASLVYASADEVVDTSVKLDLSGQYYFMENVSAGLSATIDSNNTSIFAQGRFYF
jgi:hypothetical protein